MTKLLDKAVKNATSCTAPMSQVQTAPNTSVLTCVYQTSILNQLGFTC